MIQLDRNRALDAHEGQEHFGAEALTLQLGQLGAAGHLSSAIALQSGEARNQGFTAPDPVGQAAAPPR
jgi:hypothetical protein